MPEYKLAVFSFLNFWIAGPTWIRAPMHPATLLAMYA